jgi:ADP-ribose pyrophosphatase YjhB (NUDIX family)
MKHAMPPRWLQWAREIQALAQSGDAYAVNEYQRQRYRRLNEIAAEIICEHANLQYSAIEHAFTAQIGYATPRIDVRGAVFRDSKLLLVRERSDRGWTLPGGWADVGEVPSESAEREVWEEAGFRVKARKVVGIYDANRCMPFELFHAFKILFLCELISGEARTSLETSEVAFFGPEEIPQPFSGERTKERHIRDAFAAFHNPDIATQFD